MAADPRRKISDLRCNFAMPRLTVTLNHESSHNCSTVSHMLTPTLNVIRCRRTRCTSFALPCVAEPQSSIGFCFFTQITVSSDTAPT